MIVVFLFSLFAFATFRFGIFYLKDNLFLLSAMHIGSGMTIVSSLLSLLGIIATSWLIKEAKTDLEKEKINEVS
ncbi:hypothetical protein bthur0013_59440 [Bacillus thuringiensis IBL 200]|nr:hypothetical protein A3L20_29370 [Bacillus thuringiensis]EEM92714.1 hypothetical protein bthur0013_59440 [Bacillus thuringiensis IBL 200]OTZ50878.1 hypothetical protein BK762_13450 [Bacillus thuringiensis serovar toumanoffi]MBG9634616.1 hypothetical protein [Bacillus thuringiensis]MBG9673832.1 hypothetical protein [Bacillus thuringiensis]